MPETTTQKIEETAGRYMREAEDVAQGAYRMGNNLMTTTMNFYMTNFDTLTRYNKELVDESQHVMGNMMAIYRRMYENSTKSWQEYAETVSKNMIRPAK